MGVVVIGEESIKLDEPGCEVGFLGTGMKPQVTHFVVNEYTEVTILPEGWYVHWATDVRVQMA